MSNSNNDNNTTITATNKGDLLTHLSVISEDVNSVYTIACKSSNKHTEKFIDSLLHTESGIQYIGDDTARLCVNFHNASKDLYKLINAELQLISKGLIDSKPDILAQNKVLAKVAMMMQLGRVDKVLAMAAKAGKSVKEFLDNATPRQMQQVNSLKGIGGYDLLRSHIKYTLNELSKKAENGSTLALSVSKDAFLGIEFNTLEVSFSKAEIKAKQDAEQKARDTAAAERQTAADQQLAEQTADLEAAEVQAKLDLANKQAEQKNAQDGLKQAQESLASADDKSKKAAENLVNVAQTAVNNTSEEVLKARDDADQIDEDLAELKGEKIDDDDSDKGDSDQEPAIKADSSNVTHIERDSVTTAFNKFMEFGHTEKVEFIVMLAKSTALIDDFNNAMAITHNSECRELITDLRVLENQLEHDALLSVDDRSDTQQKAFEALNEQIDIAQTALDDSIAKSSSVIIEQADQNIEDADIVDIKEASDSKA